MTRPLSEKPFARAGETITCDNGHVLGELTADLYSGSGVREQWFLFYEGWEPSRPVDPCPHCGALFIRGYVYAGRKLLYELCVDGEWRRPASRFLRGEAEDERRWPWLAIVLMAFATAALAALTAAALR